MIDSEMLRREAILRRASVEHFKRNIEAGLTSKENFKNIECGTANIVVKELYDGDLEKWTDIVNNMGAANPKVFDYMIKNESEFLKDFKKIL